MQKDSPDTAKTTVDFRPARSRHRKNAPAPPPAPSGIARSLRKRRDAFAVADIHAVPESDLISITLDAVSVTTSMFGILPKLRALRAEITATWREFDLERFDKLEQYGLALAHAHGNFNRLSAPKLDVIEAAAELTRLRDLLYGMALPLVEYGLVGRAEIDKCKVAPGYRPMIEDVITLVGLYRDHWSVLEGKVVITQEQLSRAKNLAVTLMEQLGVKEQSPMTVRDAALIRQKAFTLLIRSYEPARRAVVYLRADRGDADSIAPSFYALRLGKRRASDEAAHGHDGTTNRTPQPASTTATSDPKPPPAPFVINHRAGLPLDNPFSA